MDQTPDFEAHYQKLLTALKAQSSAPQSSIWWPSAADIGAMERLQNSIADTAVLSTQLLYLDLADQGIDPLTARVIVLSRLIVDGAPISHLRDELIAAMDAAIAPTGETSASVILFTARMQTIVGEQSTAIPTAPTFDVDRWTEALAQNIWGTS